MLVLDARGQGHSERHPDDVSPEAHVADTAFVIEQLGIAPAILIGHSLGGQRALVLAGEQPALVRALVVADSGPGEGGNETADATADYFDAWPKPFPSREAAIAHFGGPSLQSEMWADGLEDRDGGLWPRWDAEVMGPTLAVRTQVGEDEHREMGERLPHTQFVALDHSNHDLHLHQPEKWRRTLTDFLDEVRS